MFLTFSIAEQPIISLKPGPQQLPEAGGGDLELTPKSQINFHHFNQIIYPHSLPLSGTE